jgi:hypothetical protein
VFNAEQCAGLPAHYYGKAETPALTSMQRLEGRPASMLCNQRNRVLNRGGNIRSRCRIVVLNAGANFINLSERSVGVANVHALR